MVFEPNVHVIAQALEVRQLCLKIVGPLIAPDNCISLFCMAESCAIPQLQQACLNTLLQNFATAVDLDNAAFLGLHLRQLIQVVENDFVQVSRLIREWPCILYTKQAAFHQQM